MRPLLFLALIVAALSVALIAVTVRSDGRSPAEAAGTGAIGSGGGPSLGAGLPDLVVTLIESWQQAGSPCQTPAGIKVTLANQGTTNAVTVRVDVSVGFQSDFAYAGVVYPGTPYVLYFYVIGIPSGDTYTAVVDGPNDHAESDESNNTLVVNNLAVGSAATCTSTATPTVLNTPTVTPTPTGFSTQDSDGDGILGAFDNCPFNYNPFQENNDANFIDNSPPYSSAVDDGTRPMSDSYGDVCDSDDDNDGLVDDDEFEVPCPTPTPGPGPTPGPCGPAPCTTSGLYQTNKWVADTDGDRFLDGPECALGTNPLDAGSKPLLTACAPAGDSDGDKLSDRIEVCHYGTNPNGYDSDGDLSSNGARDGCEVASFNGDRIVNVADMGMLASAIANATFRVANVDVNKDGAWNPADQGLVASFISPSGQCP